jgi:ABC-2 type transport system ATP-binding protein
MSDVAIGVKNLVKKYKSSKTNSVDDISFEVKKGEFFSLLGPNGAGKTSTISILTTILAKTSGEVKVAGFDIAKNASDVRKRVGIIFQNPSLDKNLTAEENIRFHAILYGLYPFRPLYNLMPQSYKDHVNDLAKIIGLTPTDMSKAVKDMSGGMKRKLEIVRSLMHKPEILFLDEPTSGLDPQARKNLWEYLDAIRKKHKTTIFLTTHYLEEAEACDRVCVLKNGKIIYLGKPPKDTSLEKAYLKLIQD